MSSLSLLCLVAAFAVGGFASLQGVVNKELGGQLGHPLLAALFSFAVGTAVLAAVTLLVQPTWPSIATVQRLPAILWLGGLLGACFVLIMILAIPRLGTGPTIAAAVTGQLLMAVLLDHFGVLNLPVRPIDTQRVLGVILMLIGVYLLRVR